MTKRKSKAMSSAQVSKGHSLHSGTTRALARDEMPVSMPENFTLGAYGRTQSRGGKRYAGTKKRAEKPYDHPATTSASNTPSSRGIDNPRVLESLARHACDQMGSIRRKEFFTKLFRILKEDTTREMVIPGLTWDSLRNNTSHPMSSTTAAIKVEEMKAGILAGSVHPKTDSFVLFADDGHGKADRTVAPLLVYMGKGRNNTFDGFLGDLMTYAETVTQALAHTTPPHIPTSDRRVDAGYTHGMDYEKVDEGGQTTTETEDTGIYHHMHRRTMQGHAHEAPVVGAALMSGKQSNQLCNTKYLSEMSLQADIVDAMAEVFLPPAEYANLKKLFLKARLSGDHRGLFLALATNYKVNLIPHRNLKDTDLCCTVAGGHFTGGEMLFPQLDMALQYPRGSICFFASKYLWHAVADWKPEMMEPHHKVTPGRISWVWFTEQTALDGVSKMSAEQLAGFSSN